MARLFSRPPKAFDFKGFRAFKMGISGALPHCGLRGGGLLLSNCSTPEIRLIAHHAPRSDSDLGTALDGLPRDGEHASEVFVNAFEFKISERVRVRLHLLACDVRHVVIEHDAGLGDHKAAGHLCLVAKDVRKGGELAALVNIQAENSPTGSPPCHRRCRRSRGISSRRCQPHRPQLERPCCYTILTRLGREGETRRELSAESEELVDDVGGP
jgi:hypothetical protein